MHAQRTQRPSNTERRTRILSALEDGEWFAASIAAWADLSDQQTRADLAWLEREGFAAKPTDAGWEITGKGREYLAGLSDEEKTW